MRAAAGLTILALGLAACSTPSYPTKAPAPAAPEAPAPAPAPGPAPAPAPPVAAPRSPIPQPQASARDQCGAADLQGLVGRPRTEIPVPLEPNRQRVACTSCPVTEDFDPTRLNFFFDAESGRIKQIRCG
jgi:hypothetical protein